MKIGIEHGAYESYARMYSHGYRCADYQALCDTNGVLYQMDEDNYKRTLLEERKRANEAGITFSQVHAPWPTDDLTEASRAQKLEYMKRAIRGTAYLDGKYLVVHPVMPFGWGSDDDPAFTVQCNETLFVQLCTYGNEYGVGIAVENMPFVPYRLSRTAALVEFVDRLRASYPAYANFGICLDTGHANFLGEDSGDMARLCGERLKVLHVHDNNGKQDEHKPPYEGTINWESFKAALAEIGFSGCLSLETRIIRSYPTPLMDYMERGLAKTAQYLAGDKVEE